MTVEQQRPADGEQSPTGGQPPTGGDGSGLPSFPEQVSQQLGGWRGMVEAAIPITFFVVVNWLWALRPAIVVAVAVALVIAVGRLVQRRPVRYAVNGLFGIGVGAVLALNSGEARDFYLPGILVSYGYVVAMLASVAVRHPLVGWLWSVMFMQGRSDWRRDPVLRRPLTWLTLAWAAVWTAKVTAQLGLYLAEQVHALGVARIVLGAPVFAVMLMLTIWIMQRVQRQRTDVATA